jgi:Concanavalin A-like lectin/glucanases superfamily/Carbohydrate family 9 binding domain-like
MTLPLSFVNSKIQLIISLLFLCVILSAEPIANLSFPLKGKNVKLEGNIEYITDHDGKAKGAAVINEEKERIIIKRTGEIKDAFTLDCRFMLQSQKSHMMVMISRAALIRTRKDNTLRFFLWNGTKWAEVKSSYHFQEKKWYHVVLGYSNGEAKIIVNNKLIVSKKAKADFSKASKSIVVGSFFGNFSDMAISNLKLYNYPIKTSVKKSTSVNLLPNSSFEQSCSKGVPDGYDKYLGPKTSKLLNKWFDCWKLDDTTAFHGKNSMKLTLSDKGLAKDISLCPPTHSVIWEGGDPDKVYTFSAYLKADRKNLPVRLGMGMKNKKDQNVIVGKKWKRFSVTGKIRFRIRRGVKSFSMKIHLNAPGVLWIDALQLEENKSPSKYQLSFKDEFLFPFKYLEEDTVSSGTKKRFNSIKCKQLSEAPKLDGRLDTVWKNAVKITKFKPFGKTKKIKNKTEAYLGQYKESLFIAFKCYDSNIKNLKKKATHRDGKVWDDDCVEVFIDPYLDRTHHAHFAVNALGTQYDAWKKTELNWNPKWKSVCKIYDSYWICEMEIPLLSFPRIKPINNSWGISLCREAKNPKEDSAWGGGFHKVRDFIVLCGLNVPQKYTYKFNYAKVSLIYTKENSKALKISFKNYNNKDFNCKARLTVSDSAGKSISQTKSVKLRKNSSINLVYKKIHALKKSSFPYKTVVTLLNSKGKTFFTSSEKALEFCAPVEIITDRNYYTKEKNAKIVANVNISPKPGKPYSIVLDYVQNGKTKLNKSLLIKKSGRYVIDFPVKKLQKGNNVIAVKILNYGKDIVYNTKLVLKKLTPKPNEVKINKIYHNILVNNKPFFPFAACYLRVNRTRKEWNYFLKTLVAQGFNTIIPTFAERAKVEGLTDAEIIEFLDLCQKYNLKVILWNNPNPVKDKSGKFIQVHHFKDIKQQAKYREKEMLRLIKITRNHPAILAYYYWDEPKKEHYELCFNIYKNLQKAAPYHPIQINVNNIWGTSRFVKKLGKPFPADIASLTHYPIGISNASVTAKDMRELYNISGKAPVMPWLQFWAGRGRYPSRDELISMAYQSIISNAIGLQFWPMIPTAKDLWNSAKQLSREMKVIKKYLFSFKSSNTFTLSEEAINVRVLDFDDKIIVIAANGKGKTLNVDIDISSQNTGNKNTVCEVLFEKRNAKLNNSKIIDTFKAYERHVYKITK